MATITTTEFRKRFAARDKEFVGGCWTAAQRVIVEEVGKFLEGEANDLLGLAEFLDEVVTDSYNATRAAHLLRDVYAFLGNFEKSWDLIVAERTRVTWEFPFFRAVIKELSFPTNALMATEHNNPYLQKNAYLPRNSRHWNESETNALKEIVGQLFDQFREEAGTNILEHYARLHDKVTLGIEKETGESFKPYWKVRPLESGVEDKRAFRDTALRWRESLETQLHGLRDKLIPEFETEEAFKSAAERTISERFAAWQQGQVWDRKEFLHDYVYEFWTTQSIDRFDLRKLYQKHFCIGIPLRYAVIDAARANRFKRIWREAENVLRSRQGMPAIGEGWISESKMIAQLRAAFPGVKIMSQASPAWLGKMRFDAYFPDYNIAVEYQGLQHYDAVGIFGGEAGLVTTQARDKKKRELCALNGCRVVEVKPGYDAVQLSQEIRSMLDAPRENELPAAIVRESLSTPRRIVGKVSVSSLGAHDVLSCARHGTGELIRSMAAAGTDFEKLQKKHQDSLIFRAATAGNLETLRAFIEIGLKVNAEDCQRKATALARLCNGWEGPPNLAAVRLLLEAGADVRKSAPGYAIHDRCAYAPPLIGAAIDCNLALAQLLCEFGAGVNIRHKESGYTPFLAACREDHRRGSTSEARLTMLKWLLAQGANPRAMNGRRESALDLALQSARADQIDFVLVDFLVGLDVPFRLSNAYSLQDEANIAPTPEIQRLVEYGSSRMKRADTGSSTKMEHD